MSAEDVSFSVTTVTSSEHRPLAIRVWAPASTPRAIVQIGHGMSEYIERYDDFARFLAAQGFLVCGHNHVGHGADIEDPEMWGIIPAISGKELFIADYHAVRTVMQKTYGEDIPYFVFGHSMGSFVVRAYVALHGEGLAGAVVCGTGHNPKAVCDMGAFMARVTAMRKGDAYRSKFLNGLADGAYAKAIPDARTPFDWLNTDPAKVDEYIADPACGFMFSAGGYVALMELTSEVADKKRIAGIRKDLPVLFIAGDQDPVAANGKGVETVFGMFKDAGLTDVQCKLYEGLRHEILNEPTHAEVYEDVLAWLNAHLPAAE